MWTRLYISECAMRREHRRPRICRSAFVAADCILQIANYRSEFWCMRVLFPLDSCIFLQISVCSWCLLSIRFVSGGVGNLRILLQKCFRNALNMMPKSIQTHSESLKNQPKWSQGAFQKRSREQVGSTRFARLSFWSLFGATWAMWLGIFCPAGRQGAPKIKLFGTKSSPKL